MPKSKKRSIEITFRFTPDKGGLLISYEGDDPLTHEVAAEVIEAIAAAEGYSAVDRIA
jgi:hypothetical protein